MVIGASPYFNPDKKKVAVALSGGVDSLCALLLLKQQGHDVTALHGLFTENAELPVNLANTCKYLNVPLHVLDLRQEFKNQIIIPFLRDIKNNLTPNPCIHCNKVIKFGLLLKEAMNIGADYLATGHYCSLKKTQYDNKVLLGQAADTNKDQAYFLGLVNPSLLKKIIFPLGSMEKSQTREIIKRNGLVVPVSKESQDICFLEGESLSKFISRNMGELNTGPILLRTSSHIDSPLENLPKVGEHQGLEYYTSGQRKGLGIPWHEPLYVREKDYIENALILAPRELMNMQGCVIKDFNFFLPLDRWPKKLYARMRYKQPLIACQFEISGPNLHVFLNKPCFTSAPGQLAAIYDANGYLLGSGIIHKVIFN